MKLIHISDLHIGKRLYGTDLEDDQRYILSEITDIIRKEKPDAVLIAGDIYDRADPSAAAVRIFDDFLSMLADTGAASFIIYGNHDSGQRVAYGSRLFGKAGIHFSRVYDGEAEHEVLEDEHGRVNIYMLPYLRANDAAEAIAGIDPDPSERNVIVSHQFVTSARLDDSEEMNVGTLDNIEGSCYSAFDYAALGHIHMPQTVETGGSKPSAPVDEEAEAVGNDREHSCDVRPLASGQGACTVRYSGSPLAYSFSGSDRIKKSVTVIRMNAKGDTEVRTTDLKPLHEMRTIKGLFDDLINDEKLIEECKGCYLKVILTDDSVVTEAMRRLQKVFDNVLTLEYEYMREQSDEVLMEEVRSESSPDELFDSLYREQHGGTEMSEYQKKVMDKLIAGIWGGQEDSDETD